MKSRLLILLLAAGTLSTWGCAYTHLVKPEPFGKKDVTPKSRGAHTDIEPAAIGKPAVIKPESGEKPADKFVGNPEPCIKGIAVGPEVISISADGHIVAVKNRRHNEEEISLGVAAGEVVFAIPILSIWTGDGILPAIIAGGPGGAVRPRPTTF